MRGSCRVPRGTRIQYNLEPSPRQPRPAKRSVPYPHKARSMHRGHAFDPSWPSPSAAHAHTGTRHTRRTRTAKHTTTAGSPPRQPTERRPPATSTLTNTESDPGIPDCRALPTTVITAGPSPFRPGGRCRLIAPAALPLREDALSHLESVGDRPTGPSMVPPQAN